MTQSGAVQLATSIECVLFDLDGTLIDTAEDFHIAVNKLLAKNDTDPISSQLIRQTVSDGARALVKLAFSIEESDPHFDELNQQLLELYFVELENTQSVLYPGMDMLLTTLEKHGVPWGIVTNKPEKYSTLLLDKLGLLTRCKSLVCPDHVSERKPHPEPILLACQQLGVGTERTVYLGDHLRDIQAAKNADVIAIAAAYGYLTEGSKVEEWYADFILAKPDQAISLLNLLKFA
ncbi:MAG TPA: HAD family hydrolase [Porticoccaceae bacterium]|jgi:phosphoglycolate phosphatase|nr:HAD family hydrolase [Gammaproteobacteria bacterium]HIL60466.1 HAD family hydrolase [Porticoccaceae bacterium]